MIRVKRLISSDIIKIGTFVKPYTRKYDHNFLKIKVSVERQRQLHDIKTFVSNVIDDRNICDMIGNFVMNVPYKIELDKDYEDKIKEENICILPVIKQNTIFGVLAKDFEMCMEYEEELLCCLSDEQKDYLYVSHMVNKAGNRYVCLGIARMYELYYVKKAYQEAYQLMKNSWLNRLNSNDKKERNEIQHVLNDWFEQEVSTYIFKRQLMSKEVIYDNMKYIKTLTKKQKIKMESNGKNKMVKKYLIK